jgi:hypothetical protein
MELRMRGGRMLLNIQKDLAKLASIRLAYRLQTVGLAMSLGFVPACGTEEKADKGEVESDDEDNEIVFKFSELKLPYKTDDACVDHAKKERKDTSEMTACMCEKCLELMQECDVLPGCVEIIQCSRRSNCTNEYTCYLFPGAPCTETVDRWGNASVATAVSLQLMECAQSEKCR